MRPNGNPPKDDPGNSTDPNFPDELLANLRPLLEEDEPTKPGGRRASTRTLPGGAEAPNEESYPGFNGRLKREPKFQAESGGRSAARYAGESRPAKRQDTQPDEPAVILNQTMPLPTAMSQARKTIPYRDKIVPLSIHKTLPYEDKILPLNKLDRAAPYDADYQAPTPPALTPQKDIPTFVPAPKKEKRDIDVKFWAKGLFVVAAAMIGLLLIAFYIRNHQRPEAPEAAESNNATPTVAAVDNPPVYTQPATPQPPVTAATPTALPPVATTQVAIATPPVVAPPPMATTPKGVPNPPVTARKNPTPPDSTLPKRPSGQSSLQGRLPTLPKTTAKDDWESTSIPK